ncbi:MAG TPA: RdgB/HAM1 family non-canonical purine NTP pyrophosphatase [Candidatus Faeciplasma gallinarum]|uniref:dITP/XTP pyrophosphatase n=1 Tax=Candidatus Faeciplasma gallinarum TaxID=2840799 RepID=A0A9D1ENL6_9FIRM|nr:RdgB/HAM1 family non-canonical purine NTP pyrophosphatase [Candidatus Faeciplasma gallinarum]
MDLILASNNKDKLKEVKRILSPYGFNVKSQSEAGIHLEAEETGTTFAENSAIKAKALYDIIHKPVIADDSGLEVDALGKEPGVYSARYGGEGVDDIGRCYLVLNKLEGVPDSKRTARFVCVITYIDENGEMTQFDGKIEGRIGYERIGDNGFGYDPIFVVGDRTLAQYSEDEKNAVSHRGEALRKLEEYLKTKIR